MPESVSSSYYSKDNNVNLQSKEKKNTVTVLVSPSNEFLTESEGHSLSHVVKEWYVRWEHSDTNYDTETLHADASLQNARAH